MSRPVPGAMLAAIGLTIAGAPALADTDAARPPAPEQNVSVSLFAPVAGLLVSALAAQDVLLVAFEYERSLTPSWTAYVGPGFGVGTLYGKAFGGPSLGLGGRYYFGILDAKAPLGLWLGPELTASYFFGLGAKAWNIGLGAYAGYNFLLTRGLILSAGIGAYLRDGTFGLGLTPGARLNLGWAF